MVKPAVDIFGDFLSSIELSSTIGSITAAEGQTELQAGNVYHARKGMTVKIDSSDYTVVSVDPVTDKLVVNAELAEATELIVPDPLYLHGTAYAVNNRLSGAGKDAAPLSWLHEVLRDRRITRWDSLIDREIEIRWFILDFAKGEYSTGEHYSAVIQGLHKYLDKAESEMKAYNGFVFGQVPVIDRYPHANFGEFLKLAGYRSHILDLVCSGIEVRLTLPIKKKLDCS